MDILLTGGTGFIGSAVLTRLVADGHRVTAVVRSEKSAAQVEAAGATAVQGDLTDVAWLSGRLQSADGAIHTAAGSDEDDPALNDAVIDAVLDAFGGTGKPFVHTGGIWTYGDNADITESDAPNPPAITAWRPAGERRVLGSDVRASVVQPGIVYGHGQGLPNLVAQGPRDDEGALVLIGTGEQHWATVHVDDLADLYVRVLEAGPGGCAYVAASGDNPTVRALGEAAADTVVPGSDDEARHRLNPVLAEALLLDQQASGAAARGLGWEPSRPSLVELLAAGYPEDR